MVKKFKVYQFPAMEVEDSSIGWAVILAKYQNQWVFVKHKERDTFEAPGGTREKHEGIAECAKRELYEETGAMQFKITALEVYSIKHENHSVSYGQLFYAEISELSGLPESEIKEVKLFNSCPKNLTYPFVHSVLFQRAVEYSENLK